MLKCLLHLTELPEKELAALCRPEPIPPGLVLLGHQLATPPPSHSLSCMNAPAASTASTSRTLLRCSPRHAASMARRQEHCLPARDGCSPWPCHEEHRHLCPLSERSSARRGRPPVPCRCHIGGEREEEWCWTNKHAWVARAPANTTCAGTQVARPGAFDTGKECIHHVGCREGEIQGQRATMERRVPPCPAASLPWLRASSPPSSRCVQRRPRRHRNSGGRTCRQTSWVAFASHSRL